MKLFQLALIALLAGLPVASYAQTESAPAGVEKPESHKKTHNKHHKKEHAPKAN